MAVIPYTARARTALLHKTYSTYWVAVGKTTAWDDELAPPSPEAGLTDIEEHIVFVKAELVSLCRFVNSQEDVMIRGRRYRYVEDSNALTELGRFIYIKARFDPSIGQPYGIFRQMGVFSNLVPAAGHTDDLWLDPDDVEDTGVLEYVENTAPIVMSLEREEIVQVIFEFK